MHRSPSTARLYLALLVAALAAACSPDLPTDAQTTPDLAKGGKPGGGTVPGIAPTKLGNLKLIGCTWAEAHAISSAASPLVVGMAGGCGNPGNKPFIWSSATGLAATGKSQGHWPRAVSDDGTMVGGGPDFRPAEFDMMGMAQPMPLPVTIVWGEATGLTRDGLHAVGYGQTGQNSPYFVLWWGRSSVTGDWEPAVIIGKGMARGVAAGGNLVVGDSSGNAVVWRRNGAGWDRTTLGAGEALAITSAGKVIVGSRDFPLAKDPTRTYPAPTAWTASGGSWVAQTLKGADPNFDEGTVYGVAEQKDGSVVAAGFAWENTAGPGGTPWALAWRLPAGETAFSPPSRLQPLSGTYGAVASGVNARGQVVGTAFTGNGRYAVMWQLP